MATKSRTVKKAQVCFRLFCASLCYNGEKFGGNDCDEEVKNTFCYFGVEEGSGGDKTATFKLTLRCNKAILESSDPGVADGHDSDLDPRIPWKPGEKDDFEGFTDCSIEITMKKGVNYSFFSGSCEICCISKITTTATSKSKKNCKDTVEEYRFRMKKPVAGKPKVISVWSSNCCNNQKGMLIKLFTKSGPWYNRKVESYVSAEIIGNCTTCKDKVLEELKKALNAGKPFPVHCSCKEN